MDDLLLTPVREFCEIVLNYYAYALVSATVTPFSQFYVSTGATSQLGATATTEVRLQGSSFSFGALPETLLYVVTSTPSSSLAALSRAEVAASFTDLVKLFAFNQAIVDLLLRYT